MIDIARSTPTLLWGLTANTSSWVHATHKRSRIDCLVTKG